MTEAELAKVDELAETYRARLYDLSWFKRTLNETIARLANAEDGVKGRFWEDRFKSQALLDEPAILAAMAYVDLNPVRVGMAETPETSDHTSIQERVGEASSATESEEAHEVIPSVEDLTVGGGLAPESQVQSLPKAPLMPFDATGRTPWAIPFAFEDYLELVDWTGRTIRDDKRGHICERQPKILERLGIDGEAFIAHAGRLLRRFGTAVGAPSSLTALCARRQSRYLRGLRMARQMFPGQLAA